MTTDQIKKSILKGELQLSFFEKVTHYGFTAFCFFFPLLFVLLNLIANQPTLSIYWQIFMIALSLILGILSYLKQKRNLQFIMIESKLSKDKIVDIIRNLSYRLNWEMVIVKPQIIVATSSMSFSENTWGERITILFDKNKVLVNSINDPKEQSSITKGRNKKNVDEIISILERRNK